MPTLNVIDTAIRTGIFQTFTRLLEGSPLEQRLRSRESFTLFAPVDISFAYLSPETFDGLLRAESQGLLSDVLGYHVVPGKIMFRELCDISETPTVCGVELTVDNTVDLKVNGAKILHVDIVASNGVIHGIDRLLMPVKSAAAASR
ncbi:MAG TPA: fasciclin domain-containing protein [Pyrinomonadaceae bacterium]|nr:fasciclin domain-containing protein [Pyrinomonadaceae bacterium]